MTTQMSARYLEVVRIVGPGLFVDAEDNGYYVAMRSGERVDGSWDANPRFYGPFPTPAQAHFLAVSAEALGLARPEVPTVGRLDDLPRRSGVTGTRS
jgi:hypothetical protein